MGFDKRRIPSFLLVGPPYDVRLSTPRSGLLARLGLRRFSSPTCLAAGLDLRHSSPICLVAGAAS